MLKTIYGDVLVLLFEDVLLLVEAYRGDTLNERIMGAFHIVPPARG